LNHFRRIFLPSVALSFMYTTLFASIINLLQGHRESSNIFNLQLLIFLVAINVMNYLLLKIPFSSFRMYVVVEGVLFYLFFIAVSYAFNWSNYKNLATFIINSLLFFLIYTLVQCYFYKLVVKEAEDINRLIK
jgi:hypothetical protein